MGGQGDTVHVPKEKQNHLSFREGISLVSKGTYSSTPRSPETLCVSTNYIMCIVSSGTLLFMYINLFNSKGNPERCRKGAKIQQEEDSLSIPATLQGNDPSPSSLCQSAAGRFKPAWGGVGGAVKD